MTLLQHKSLYESNASWSQSAQKKPFGNTLRSSVLPIVSAQIRCGTEAAYRANSFSSSASGASLGSVAAFAIARFRVAERAQGYSNCSYTPSNRIRRSRSIARIIAAAVGVGCKISKEEEYAQCGVGVGSVVCGRGCGSLSRVSAWKTYAAKESATAAYARDPTHQEGSADYSANLRYAL